MEYMTNGRNGAQAALSAGYAKSSAKIQANKLLKMPYVIEKLEELEKEFVKNKGMEFEEILSLLEAEAKDPENKGSERIQALREYSKLKGFYELDNSQKNPYKPEPPAPKNDFPHEWE